MMRAPVTTGIVAAMLCLFSVISSAGAYFFADETNGVDLVTHPSTYTGSGGVVTVRICIDPASPNATDMEYSIQNNIDAYNQLTPTTDNMKSGSNNNIPSNYIDFESVALHEIGHCLGMAHVNAATESGLPNSQRNYTKATDGPNETGDVFDLDPGADGVIGSSDDIRGDDVNLVWFRRSNNDPFTIDGIIDSTTYSRNIADLPTGHSFAANADRAVSTLLGHPKTEAVMQQGTFFDEAQRTLGHDDVATLLYAASGIDERKNGGGKTRDNYSLVLEYGGISTMNCHVSMSFTNTPSLAFCSAGGIVIGSNHVRMNAPIIEFGQGFNWFFNSADADGDGVPNSTDNCPNDPNPLQENNDDDGLGDACDPDDDNDGLSDTDEASYTDPFLADTDGDGLVDGTDGVVLLATLPGGIDADEDGYVDGEQDLGTDPTTSNVGDLAPRGMPNDLLNAGDLLVLTQLVTGVITPTALELALADINGDSLINAADLLRLQQTLIAP